MFMLRYKFYFIQVSHGLYLVLREFPKGSYTQCEFLDKNERESLAKCAMTLRDLAIARYWFIEEIEVIEESVETSKGTTDNINTNALK